MPNRGILTGLVLVFLSLLAVPTIIIGGGDKEMSIVLESYDLNGFNFGIEYAYIGEGGNAPYYATKEIYWTKWNGPGFSWAELEPNPPKDGVHTYNFSRLDRAVVNWQAGGFTNMVVNLTTKNAWACEQLKYSDPGRRTASSPPKDEEHWGYYADYVRAVVERYDGDGVGDAPGLISPIHYWEIESESQHDPLWQVACNDCTDKEYRDRRIEQYLRLLRTAREAVLEANPKARIVLAGLWLSDLFDRGPLSDAEVEELLKTPRGGGYTGLFPESMRFIKTMLSATELYDAVEFHVLNHYTGIEGSIRWIREVMGPAGKNKEIFVGDSASGPTITHVGTFQEPEYPDGKNIMDVLRYLDDRCGYTYAEIEKWLRAEQARYTAKVTLLAVGSGAAGINIFTWFDNRQLLQHPNPIARTWGIQGLRDTLESDTVGVRPALLVYQFLAKKLFGVSRAERIDLDQGVRAYRFTVGTNQLWALWLEEPIARQPDESVSLKTVNVPLSRGNYRIIHLPTERNRGIEMNEVTVTLKELSLKISDMPILVEKQGVM